MVQRLPAGSWVEVHQLVLHPEERAPGLPADTAACAYEAWICGFLTEPAAPGESATVETPAGRRVTGALSAVNPGHAHSFGPTHPALAAVGPTLRRLLAEPGPDPGRPGPDPDPGRHPGKGGRTHA